jgi:hypothetical protein
MQRFQMMIRTPQETSPHEQILFPRVKTASSCDHPLFAACGFSKPTRPNSGTIQGHDSSNPDLSQGDMHPGANFLLTNTYQAFQAILLIQEEKKTRRLGTMVELFL